MTNDKNWREETSSWLEMLPDLTVSPRYYRPLFEAFAALAFCRDPNTEYGVDDERNILLKISLHVEGLTLAGNTDSIVFASHNLGMMLAMREATNHMAKPVWDWSSSDKTAVDYYQRAYSIALKDTRYYPYAIRGIYDIDFIEHCLANDIDAELAVSTT